MPDAGIGAKEVSWRPLWITSHSQYGIYEIPIRTSRSHRLHPCILDNLCPLFGLVCDESAKGGRRVDKWRGTQVGKFCLDQWIIKCRINLLVELVDEPRGPRF